MRAKVSDNYNYYIWDDYDDLGIAIPDSHYVREKSELLKDERIRTGLKRLRSIGYHWYPTRVSHNPDGITNLELKISQAIEVASAIESSTPDGIAAWCITGKGNVAQRTVVAPEGKLHLQAMFFFNENASIDMSTFLFSASPSFVASVDDIALRNEAIAALALNMCYSVTP